MYREGRSASVSHVCNWNTITPYLGLAFGFGIHNFTCTWLRSVHLQIPHVFLNKAQTMTGLSLNITHPATAGNAVGPLIILIHGGAFSGRMFRTVIPVLAGNGYEVAAPDLPGHGASVNLGPFNFHTSTKLLVEAIEQTKRERARPVVLVGISLGGQVVLDVLQNHPSAIDAAVVSGASINPPDDEAQWEMPHMPTDQAWIDMMMEDVGIMGMNNAQDLQKQSFAFTVSLKEPLPPTLIVTGEHDVSMAKRDFEELTALAEKGNDKSESKVMQGAWHNHSIDVPEQFAAVVEEWAQKVF